MAGRPLIRLRQTPGQGTAVAVPTMPRRPAARCRAGGEAREGARPRCSATEGDLLAHRLQADAQRLERLGRYSATILDQAEQDVLGPDVVVVEHPGLFLSQDHNPPRPVGEPLEHAPRRLSPRVPLLPCATRYISSAKRARPESGLAGGRARSA